VPIHAELRLALSCFAETGRLAFFSDHAPLAAFGILSPYDEALRAHGECSLVGDLSARAGNFADLAQSRSIGMPLAELKIVT
jgi:hypothetical protein